MTKLMNCMFSRLILPHLFFFKTILITLIISNVPRLSLLDTDERRIFLNLGIFSTRPGSGHSETAERAGFFGIFVILSGVRPSLLHYLQGHAPEAWISTNIPLFAPAL